MKMEWMLIEVVSRDNRRKIGEGRTLPPPGMFTSITLFAGRLYTEPFGKSWFAFVVPLRI